MSLLALRPRLQRYARSLVHNPDFAEDLVQDTLLRAWKAQAQFVADTSMKAWTFTILRNLFLSARRRDRFHGDYDEVAAERIIAITGNQESAIDLTKVETAMAMLPEDQRQALHMMTFGGLTTEEIAKRIGAPAGTIKSRVSRARTALKLLMTTQYSGSAISAKAPTSSANKQQRSARKPQIKGTSGSLLIG
ncbi:sigma-70 family RNA polymerase sigma factor [Sphingomonas sp. PP-F2F-A104-K0414]|uniref:RNA polymerase sigma factor n=1 Tax=Sphingomonas sp. PP-F2F-A104-K0414 TaxID=2135661 RepID=UPI0014046ECF|nr:sigma-70 family RNA polymerase sigma factor [Sphingomonas sp. PP-F2F-A104-K0414]